MPVSTIPTPRPAGSGAIRVLTHNVFGLDADWDDRRRVLAAGIRALDPDLVAFQETILSEDYDQAADLLGDGYHLAHSREREPNGSGIAIGSRWPIGPVRELDLHLTPRTGDFACTALLAEIAAPAPFGSLLVVNHFPDYQVDHEVEREVQTVAVAREVEDILSRRPMPVVLAGDLDADPDAASIRFLTGRQSLDGTSVCYRDAWESAHPGEPGHTFSATNPLSPAARWDWPFRRIDHILVRHGEHGGPALRIAACELAFAEPIGGVWASDHFALVADLVPFAPAPAAP